CRDRLRPAWRLGCSYVRHLGLVGLSQVRADSTAGRHPEIHRKFALNLWISLGLRKFLVITPSLERRRLLAARSGVMRLFPLGFGPAFEGPVFRDHVVTDGFLHGTLLHG